VAMSCDNRLDIDHPPTTSRPVLPTVGRGGVVPYIVVWSEEYELPARVVRGQLPGIGYADETSADRDRDGVLWARVSSRPGEGRPLYTRLHPLRQRRAMRRLLCQVCAEPAEYTDQGHLWLLLPGQECWENWPDGVVNPHPPVCLRCARLSVRQCPPLRRGFVAVRAHSLLHGVFGVRFQPGSPFPSHADDNDEALGYGSPVIHWIQATQLSRTLHDCRILDLDELVS
jgi:hypothetical protein